MTTRETVLAFVDAINAHDVTRIVGVAALDHQFVDAFGEATPADRLEAAWTGYFRFMPHYGIEVETLVVDGETAALFGAAWGGLDAADPSSRSWRRPCAWRAEVRSGKIRLWQVYADTKIVFDLLATG
jgi:ketosteroid isomerase-like protein